jgi:hypothetical protein
VEAATRQIVLKLFFGTGVTYVLLVASMTCVAAFTPLILPHGVQREFVLSLDGHFLAKSDPYAQ